MTKTMLKMAAITSIAMLASAGTALAAGGENCDKKKAARATTTTTTMKTDATAGKTAVLGASETMTKAKKERVILSFEDAMKLCRDKGVDDLQGCVDYKTGVTKTYKKSTS